nr:HD domain-containing protein [Williamsia herbipolensis]
MDQWDWEWAISTGGVLSPAARRSLAVALIAELPRTVAGYARVAMGRRGNGRVDFNGLRLPSSRLAVAAEEEARTSLTPHVVEHSYRTYFFARALCELRGIAFDDELAFVASLLHDLHLERPTPGRCFAVTGAERAVAFTRANGADPTRAHAIGAAIAGHLTVGIADDLGGVGFVSAGAAVDVIGDRLADLDPTWVAELLERHPRLGFTQHMITALENEAAAVPGGRTRWLLRTAAFRQLIRMAAFDVVLPHQDSNLECLNRVMSGATQYHGVVNSGPYLQLNGFLAMQS